MNDDDAHDEILHPCLTPKGPQIESKTNSSQRIQDFNPMLKIGFWTRKNHWTLQKRGVGLCIAGFWDLQTTKGLKYP